MRQSDDSLDADVKKLREHTASLELILRDAEVAELMRTVQKLLEDAQAGAAAEASAGAKRPAAKGAGTGSKKAKKET